MTDKLLYRYVGPGWFPGVPPTDLTQDAFAGLNILAQLDVKAGTIYREADETDEADQPALTTLNKEELVKLAEDRGIDASGTKAEIIERIENEEATK